MAPNPGRNPNPDHDIRRTAWAESIRNGLWFIPLVAVALAAAAAALLIHLDRSRPDLPAIFEGDASSAQDLLSTIASGTLTMATLVLSLTIVALQIASQQFSPRVMRTFFRDTGTKVAVGFFLATTVYALLVLRVVTPETTDRAEFMPGVAVSFAFTLVLGSLGTFVYYLHHVAHSIRAVHIMEAVAAESRTAIRELPLDTRSVGPDEWPARPADLVLRSEQPPGSLVTVDENDLVDLARRHRARIRLRHHVGDYLPSGVPLADVWSDDGPVTLTAGDVVDHLDLARERSVHQDLAFGLRQLVDMAEKALSPAVNDPTTAVQAIDRLHDLLRRLGARPDAPGVYRDPDGQPRFVMPMHGWDEFVHLAFDEIRQYGGSSLQVQQRLRSMIDDLVTVVADDPGRVAALEAQRTLLDRAALDAFPTAHDRRRAGMREPG